MIKGPSKKVTIDVPSDKYEILKQIADETETSIRGLVRDGVDLVILNNEPLLLEMASRIKKDANEKSTNIDSVLSKLKK